MQAVKIMAITLGVLILFGCATKISGSVKLVDQNARPLSHDNLNGIVVNMMNTSVALESASHSVSTDEKGNFVADGSKLKPGTYKIEVGKQGYKTFTTTVEIGSGNNNVELLLRKNHNRRPIRIKSSDADKIINPGEVNIRPPSM